MRNEFEIIPINNDESPDKWDITKLPEVVRTFKGMKTDDFDGDNDIKSLIQAFSQYLDISKRVNSLNTRRNYIWNTKQFLLWCNSMDYNIIRVENTQELRNLAIVYNKVLLQSDIQQNTVALKMQSIRKFFEFINFKELKLDIRSAFNADWITTQDTNAFKKQVRINDQVYIEVCDYVHESGDINDKWILFFFAWGCRRSEISGVRVENIDTLNKCIHVYMQKTGEMKKLPIPDWFSGMKSFADGQIFIVTNNSKRTKKTKGVRPVTTQHIYNVTQRWLANTSFAGDIKLTPHSFRRFFINSMQKQGFSDSAIAKISGHRSVQMIARYSYDEDLAKNPIVVMDAVKY
jgi:integrase